MAINPYTALYGYTAPLGAYQVMYGASDARHKKYKKMLHLMAKRIRLKKKMARAGNSRKRAALQAEIKMLAKHIKKLRADLQSDGVNTSAAEVEAAEVEASAPDITGSTTVRRPTRSRRVTGRTSLHARRYHYRKTKMPHRHKRIKGRQGIRTSAVRHHKYALQKQRAQTIQHPWRNRARLPGQRAFDGRRRQGPISAQDVSTQDVSPEPMDDIDSALAMDPNIDPTMMDTDVPDIEFAQASEVGEALSGVMDFATGLWENKFVRWSAIGLGVWFVFGKKLR